MPKPRLHVVADEAPTLRDRIELLLIQRKHALQALAWADEELLPLRRQYARERGEYLLPSVERLQRELGL
jgi:hypothetical protein